jgi:hypothetical protein
MDDEVIADSEEDMEQEIYSGRGRCNPPLDTFLPSETTSTGLGSSNP